MIICHEYKYIFLKTMKTAGTSIEIALSKFCGPNDVITPHSGGDEKVRTALGYRGPQNYRAPFASYGLADWINLVVRQTAKKRFYHHIPAREAKPYVDPAVWNSYYKFCFVRNPWDRIISHYYYYYKKEPRPSMNEFLESEGPKILTRKSIEVYTMNGEVVVDKTCRYENLTAELEAVRTHLGIPEELKLPHVKAGHRTDRRSYHDVLTAEQSDRIAEMFKDEIQLLGYTFQ